MMHESLGLAWAPITKAAGLQKATGPCLMGPDTAEGKELLRTRKRSARNPKLP